MSVHAWGMLSNRAVATAAVFYFLALLSHLVEWSALIGRRRTGHVTAEERALVLARQQQTDHLLLLGGCSGSELSEAAAGAAWLRQHELTGEVRVELEQDSVDSLENLRHARRLLQEEGRLPPVALVTSRYHLARCLLLARRLGFDSIAVAAEPTLPRHARYLGRLVLEAGYLMWIDIGMRWARLIGHARMAARIS